MKLAQNQVWKQNDEYIRIVVLERLAVEYKSMRDLRSREGLHLHVSKKQFCRLIKGATLLSPEEIWELRLPEGTMPEVPSEIESEESPST